MFHCSTHRVENKLASLQMLAVIPAGCHLLFLLFQHLLSHWQLLHTKGQIYQENGVVLMCAAVFIKFVNSICVYSSDLLRQSAPGLSLALNLQVHSVSVRALIREDERWDFCEITKFRKEIISCIQNIYFGQLYLRNTVSITQNITYKIMILSPLACI